MNECSSYRRRPSSPKLIHNPSTALTFTEFITGSQAPITERERVLTYLHRQSRDTQPPPQTSAFSILPFSSPSATSWSLLAKIMNIFSNT